MNEFKVTITLSSIRTITRNIKADDQNSATKLLLDSVKDDDKDWKIKAELKTTAR